MRWFQKIRLRIRSFFLSGVVEGELEKELRSHIEHQIEENIERGMNAEDARTEAIRSIRNLTHLKQQCRDQRGLNILDDLRQDLRYAARAFLKSPDTTFIVVLTLALGISANTAVFSVVNTVLLKPAVYPEPDRVVIFETTAQAGSPFTASPAKFNIWHKNVFDQVCAYQYVAMNLTGIERPEQIQSARASAAYFPLFGMKTIDGRVFTADEDRPNVAPTAVISAGLWRRSFGGDRSLTGKTILLSGKSYVVTGIMAASVSPDSARPVDVWIPLQMDLNNNDQNGYLTVVARLRPDATLAMARAEAQSLNREFRTRFPNALASQSTFQIEPLQDSQVSGIRRQLLVLTALVGLVLIIACSNVTNIL